MALARRVRDFKVSFLPARLPVVFEFAAELTAAQGDNGIGAAHGLEHSRPFEPAQYGFTPSLDHLWIAKIKDEQFGLRAAYSQKIGWPEGRR